VFCIILHKWKTFKDICSIAGPVLALIAIIHSCKTDHKLKMIQYRGNAPFFVVKSVELDVVVMDSDSDGNPHYQYSDKPSELSGHLGVIDDWDPQVPDDYPDNYPVGLLLKNVGTQLRTFSVKCEDTIVFRKVLYNERLYELRYIYQKPLVGKSLRFTIEYETYEGIQGAHTWETIIGEKSLRRVKPPVR